MNRAERRLLAKAKGDLSRAAEMAMTRSITGSRASQNVSLINTMDDEAAADAFEQAFSDFAEERDHE